MTLLLAKLKSTCDCYLITMVAVETLVNISRSELSNLYSTTHPVIYPSVQ